ncbi:hypothetical protein C0J50_17422 [Silurus asotus]|uniref:Fibronectin type-III domain-containing protein n=1 Tax=Silurus asotus TaxID=30991 RepID=A0AAD5FMV5_SILAS|nr:hypothetical protein C0J50_17422 [Silurus asotus]
MSTSQDLKIKNNIMDILTMKLTLNELQAKSHKLEMLKRSSYYIKVLQLDDEENQMSTSTFIHFFDVVRFQDFMRDCKVHVKLQLKLLERLYKELVNGKEELNSILDQRGDCLAFGEDAIQKKICELYKTTEDFDTETVFRELEPKNSLIPDLESKNLPKFSIVMEVENPVVFIREQTQAFCDSVVLHWQVEEQEQQKPDEVFEIFHKLTNPTNEVESREFGSLICSGYFVTFSNLRQEHSYQFSVKRREINTLVHEDWSDTIVLTTTSPNISVKE